MNKKIILSIILLLVIIGMGAFLIIKGEDLLRQEIMIEYPDGCTEFYVNGVIQGPECEQPIYGPGGITWNTNLTSLG